MSDPRAVLAVVILLASARVLYKAARRLARRSMRRWERRALRWAGRALLGFILGRWVTRPAGAGWRAYRQRRNQRRAAPAGARVPDPTLLYRHYDATGRLLYVGITRRGVRRWEEHAEDKPWFELVATSRCEEHPTRAAALYAEAVAIRDENPVYNICRPDPANV